MTKNTFFASVCIALVFSSLSPIVAEDPKGSLKQYGADNSKVNVRDEVDRGALTADDQSLTNENQTKNLAAIRRAVVDMPNLSVNGQNIKIMLNNKTVTLRGPVASVQEREAIEETVRNTAPSLEVTNLLEVAK